MRHLRDPRDPIVNLARITQMLAVIAYLEA
jgi:hypothetical protein